MNPHTGWQWRNTEARSLPDDVGDRSPVEAAMARIFREWGLARRDIDLGPRGAAEDETLKASQAIFFAMAVMNFPNIHHEMAGEAIPRGDHRLCGDAYVALAGLQHDDRMASVCHLAAAIQYRLAAVEQYADDLLYDSGMYAALVIARHITWMSN